MAWSWTASGRVDSFEYELIPVASVNSKPSGKLTGVTGGQLNFDYYSSEKVSGTLEVVNAGFVRNCYVRIWYKPTLAGAGSKKVELATCFASTEKSHYEDGIYSGEVELHGVLWRFTQDKLHKNFTAKEGESAVGCFKRLFEWLGGQYRIVGVKDRKLSKNHVFERGTAPMEALQWLADYVGAEVTCDTHGRVVLQKYVAPGKKPVAYAIPTGGESVTMPGIDISSTHTGTVNRVSVRHEWTEQVTVGGKKQSVKKSLLGIAVASKTSAISRQKAGRYVTETYDLDAMKPLTQARIDAIAKTKLKRASAVTTSVQFDTISYLPIHIGQVVKFRYDKMSIQGMVASIDLGLSAGCPMNVTLRKVRNG